jgi:3-phosphoshikimate 1-carboxyvinyltransferase
MTDLLVHPAAKPLIGSVPVPSDKSIGHRALLFSAIANGTSRITGFAGGEDNRSTAAALRAMGVSIDERGGELLVRGVGIFGLRAPHAPLDCGNSGTTMRLLCGLLAPQPFACTLVGDASLSRRPMGRVIEPLRARGARIDGAPHPRKSGDVTPPLVVHGLPEGTYLGPLQYDMPVASAQVKSALLLSGLYAHGVTVLKEPHVSRDHTERMLAAQGAPLEAVGALLKLDPAGWNGQLEPLDMALPGDLSAAAFLIVAAQLVPGSQVTVRDVGTNPTRTGVLDAARDMGAGLRIEPHGERGGEPVADLHVFSDALRGGKVGGELLLRAIDEVPILCALAARARGETIVCDAEELRVKETDRIVAMAEILRAFGVECEERPDGMRIVGKPDGRLRAAEVHSHGDHRIAMTSAVLALAADGPTRIHDVDCIATSYPKFVGTLRALGATVEVR